MILLQDKTNITTPNSEYPNGQIRDRDGIIPGTPGSVEVYGDMHQFFDKLIRESTIIPNGVLDSEYNGYQLWESFIEHVKNMRNYTRYYAQISQFSTNAPTIDYVRKSDIGAPISIVRSTVGRYELYFSDTPFDLSGKTEIFLQLTLPGFSDPYVAGTNQINIYTYDTSGAYADSILDFASLTIRTFD